MTMAATQCYHGNPRLKIGNTSWGQISGIIELKSDKLRGAMVISFDESSILAITARILGEEPQEINQTVVDAVGEITNMISGGAKRELSELGYNFDLTIPAVVIGRDVEMSQLSGSCITLPFKTDVGEFVVEANIVPID